MDSERVEVLHIADSDTVVIFITDHLILNLFPALERLLHKNLRRERESLGTKFFKLLVIVTETRTQTAKSIGSTDNQRITEFMGGTPGLLHILGRMRLYGLDIDFIKFLHEKLAVLSIHDSLDRSTEHLDTIFLQNLALIQFHTAVKRCLATE